MVVVSELIDTTEMYLRTLFELSEEGVLPMRARIAERLSQSGPTVSQTVARMQRDGLLELDSMDRHVVLSATGHNAATRVMRKHRLAECLLVRVIGLPWEEVHAEACRWEHVMSDAVERRLLELLDHPRESPFGNPIPGLALLDPSLGPDELQPGIALSDYVGEESRDAVIVRLGEPIQGELQFMAALHRVGSMPGCLVSAEPTQGGVRLGRGGEFVELTPAQASMVIVVQP
jgi:DtxR family Mn-dependent transcriptional regulator